MNSVSESSGSWSDDKSCGILGSNPSTHTKIGYPPILSSLKSQIRIQKLSQKSQGTESKNRKRNPFLKIQMIPRWENQQRVINPRERERERLRSKRRRRRRWGSVRESCAVTSKRRSFINGWANQPFECVQLTCCNSFFVFRFFFWDFDVWEVKTENWKGKKKKRKEKKKVSFGLLSNAESGTYFPMKMGWENQPEEQWDFAEMATTSHHCLIVAGMTTNSKSIYIQSISHHAFLVRFWKKTSTISEH